MRPSTVDLLRIRDGEPVDARVRAAIEADTQLRAELARLHRMGAALRSLPTLRPPADAWDKIAARLDATGPRALSRSSSWVLRAGIAACVAVVALAIVTREPAVVTAPSLPNATVVAGATSTGRPLLGTPVYASLVAQSAQLERALAGMDRQRRVVRVGTAATVARLENRIADIDNRLTFSRQLGLDDAAIRGLYQRRVDLMNALVQVRYADHVRYANEAPDLGLRRFEY